MYRYNNQHNGCACKKKKKKKKKLKRGNVISAHARFRSFVGSRVLASRIYFLLYILAVVYGVCVCSVYYGCLCVRVCVIRYIIHPAALRYYFFLISNECFETQPARGAATRVFKLLRLETPFFFLFLFKILFCLL